MSAVRSVLKEFWLSKRVHDEIIQAIAYVKNRTIIWNANSITPYEGVNKIVPSTAYFCTLGCRCYVHIPNTTLCHIIDDCG